MTNTGRPDNTADVVIVGAGPTGMVAALVLAANGVTCRVLERRTAPNDSSRALGLQARSMELLAGFGLAERVAEVAYRLTGASIMRGDAEMAQLPWVPPDSPYPYTFVLPQQGLEAILRERLDEVGIPVDAGREVDEIGQDGAAVTVRTTDGTEYRCLWLIGADGSRSRVRQQVGIEFTGVATGETYYLADTVLDPAPPVRDSAMWLGPEGPLMMMRLPGSEQLWRIFVDVTDRSENGELPEPTADLLESVLHSRGPSKPRIVRTDWTSIFRTRLCLAERYREGRVFLAGDAAHVFPPFGGQGMNLGIQDAYNLGWRLARTVRGASADLLSAYESERRPIARATIRDVELRRRTFALRNPLARGARDLLLRATSTRAAARTSRQNSQLDQSYAGRRFLRPGGAPNAGDRAPEVPLGSGTVHDLIGPDHLTLLVFPAAGSAPDPEFAHRSRQSGPGVDPWVAIVDHACDPDGRVHSRYGMRPGGWVLIRPDGHIAERGDDLTTAMPAAARLGAEPAG